MKDRAAAALRACGAELSPDPAPALVATSPIDGRELFALSASSAADAGVAARSAASAFAAWRASMPTERAAAVAKIGAAIAARQAELTELIVIETGKPLAAAQAEATAASRFCALAAEAAAQVQPASSAAAASPASAAASAAPARARRSLGPVAVHACFATPLLGWASVAPLALACGCPVVCRPEAPLVATALGAVVEAALRSNGAGLPGLHAFVLGGSDAAEALAADPAVASVVQLDSPVVNVALVAPPADLSAVARELTAAALDGAGGSPAALRLLLVHESLAVELEQRLVAAFAAVSVGDPFDPATELGPLRDLDAYRALLDAVQAGGGGLVAGGELRQLDEFPDAYYAEPTLMRTSIELEPAAAIAAPLLCLAAYGELEEALARLDATPRRWAALFGGEQPERDRFLSAPGAGRGFVAIDCRPHEADLAAPDEYAWLGFTRAVSFGFG